MGKYILCDSCHSPYDLDNNRCIVCGYTEDETLISKEIKELDSTKKIEKLLLTFNRLFNKSITAFEYTMYSSIIATFVVLMLSIYQVTETQDFSFLRRITYIIDSIWDRLYNGFINVILPDLISFTILISERLVLLLSFLWSTFISIIMVIVENIVLIFEIL